MRKVSTMRWDEEREREREKINQAKHKRYSGRSVESKCRKKMEVKRSIYRQWVVCSIVETATFFAE